MTDINSTGVNTIVTIIAIFLTLISWILNLYQWFRNEKLKDRIIAMELVAYIDSFHDCYIRVNEKLLRKNWYKGSQGADISHELSIVLSDYNRYRNLFDDDECISLDPRYSEAQRLYLSFFGENAEYKDRMIRNLYLIDQTLQTKKIEVQGYLGKL
jgi:hypothetical protein